METVLNIINYLNGLVWGTPMVILLVGGGLYLAFVSKFTNLTYFVHALKILKESKDDSKKDQGQLSHFQALTNALSATVGLGNIAGVAVAITQGGPGAVFWMWVSAILGMNTKFFECTLSMMFRGKDYKGEVQGGPMYVMEYAFKKIGKPLGMFFAIFALIGTLGIFQANQLSSYLSLEFSVPPYITGIVCSILILGVILGGVQRIGQVTAYLVPFMCGIYLIAAILILIFEIDKIPGLFMSIINNAFSIESGVGAASGIAIREVLQIGIKRAAFSNEAGMGTAPMAHSNAQTSEPVKEGLVAMLGPFFDTIIVCTITAFVILLGINEVPEKLSGISLTLTAFKNLLPTFGPYILGMATLLFSFTTMLGMANYNEKCWSYVFKGKMGGHKTFYAYYCGSIFLGTVLSLDVVVGLIDLSFGLMAIPNVIVTLLLAGKVKERLRNYKESL